MTWVLLIAVAWSVLALAAGMLIGRMLRAAGPAVTAEWIDEVELFLGKQPGARTIG
jgi:hypothetical protein